MFTDPTNRTTQRHFARFIYARNGWVCCVRDPPVRSDYPIDSPHSADSESFGDRAKFAQIAVAGVITKPIQPLTLTEEVAEILGWVD